MDLTKQVKDRLAKPIVLIGFMGCGKSTLGSLLARRSGAVFVDLDVLIAKKAGRTIPEIFARQGERGFRRLESQVLKAQLHPGRVLAAGGGLVTIPLNRELLRSRRAHVVWVDVSWPSLWQRLEEGRKGARPLLADKATGKPRSAAAVRRLWSARRAVYRETANVRLVVRKGEPPGATEARLCKLLGL
ncbi:MAG: shikimate kinase [Deltaproteobacteria bacterium]|nr:shikimate kinase [Deltaproteobacteria bacterium]